MSKLLNLEVLWKVVDSKTKRGNEELDFLISNRSIIEKRWVLKVLSAIKITKVLKLFFCDMGQCGEEEEVL